jgi:uncharacterized lipoprotein
MTKLLSAALVVVAASLCGCALTTERINIQYKPLPSAMQVPGAGAISVNVQVSDQRQDKSKVSSKKNGFGMEMAPILANEEPAITIRRAIEQELAARGFRLAPESATIVIACDLTRFYNEHKVGFFAGDAVAELNMFVLVRAKDGRQLYSREVIAQGIEPNTQLMNGNNAMLALNQALSNGMKMLFEDQAFVASLSSSGAPLASGQ